MSDWKEGLEKSRAFLAIVSQSFFEDTNCIEQYIYAKNQNKPMILLIHRSFKLDMGSVVNFFRGSDVRAIIFFDEKDLEKDLNNISTQLIEDLNKIKE